MTPRSVNGVNIGGGGRSAAAARALREPALGPRDEAGIAQPQVLVRDALAARQQAVRELQRVERRVAVDVLEPFGGVARGVLQLQHFDAAFRLVCGAAPRACPAPPRSARGERDARPRARASSPSRPRSARYARRRRSARSGTSRSRDARPVRPRAADDARKADPDRRPAQVRRVGHAAVRRRDSARTAARRTRCSPPATSRSSPAAPPHVLRRLDDERRRVAVVLVRVRLEPAVRRLLERERERGEALLRAEPDEAAAAQVDVRRERSRHSARGRRLLMPSAATMTSASNAAAAACSSSTSVSKTSSTPSASQRCCRMFSSRLRPMPQKPWPPDVIVRPLKWTSMSSQRLKAPAISRGRLGVGGGEVAERLVGKDDAPAERVVRRGCARRRGRCGVRPRASSAAPDTGRRARRRRTGSACSPPAAGSSRRRPLDQIV